MLVFCDAKRFFLIILMAVQCLLIFRWNGYRQNYFVDELYSLSDAHTFFEPGGRKGYFHERPDFIDTWMDADLYYEQLLPPRSLEDTGFSAKGLLRRFFRGRNYMGLIGLAERSAGTGDGLAAPSVHPGIRINLLFFVLMQVFLYCIAEKLQMSFPAEVLCLLLGGSCALAVSMQIYLRFYSLTAMLVTGVLCLHASMAAGTSNQGQDKGGQDRPGQVRPGQDLPAFLLMELGSILLLYFGFRNSELVCVIAAALVTGFCLLLFLDRRYAELALYAAGTVIPGTVLILTGSAIPKLFRDPASVISDRGAGGRVLSGLLSIGPEVLLKRAGILFSLLRWLIFGKWKVMAMLAAFLAGGILMSFLPDGGIPGSSDGSGILGSPEDSGSRKDKAPRQFYLVLCWILACYLLFLLLTGLWYSRYLFLILPVLSLVLSGGAERAAGSFRRKIRRGGKIFSACILALGIWAAFLPFYDPLRIEFLYQEDRPAVEAVREYRGLDNLYICSELPLSSTLYECIALNGKGTRLMAAGPSPEEFLGEGAPGLPDRFLIWIDRQHDPEPYIAVLKERGYRTEMLGETHESIILWAGYGNS